MNKEIIYLDNAASAPVNPSALAAAVELFGSVGNPSSVHTEGRKAALAIKRAREQCAAAIGAEPSEIIFTSGGTESDNMAVKCAAYSGKKRHIVTTAIEHAAVLNSCKALSGFEISYVPPDENGFVSAEKIKKAVRTDTALVSVMAANNEIGTFQPIAEIGEFCCNREIPFHTDAVQAIGNIPINVREIKADLLSCSAHKIGGIPGCGFLYARNGLKLVPLIDGGGQEYGLRSGTENAPAIAAMGIAIENNCKNIPQKSAKISQMRDRLIDRLKKIPDSILLGSQNNRLCGNVCFSFAGISGESLVLNLDLMGVRASSGSACISNTGGYSHVLRALNLPEKWISGSLRLSISEHNTPEEIEKAASAVEKAVDLLRSAY